MTPLSLRHWIYENPELSLREYKITNLLEQEIRKISDRLIILKPLPTGLVVVYPGQTDDYVLIRADIDALLLQEGPKHACGHDVHTSVLYSLIQQVVSMDLSQSCLFLFQPGEESGGGAKQILDSGVLDSYSISKAMSLHVSDEFEQGTVAVKEGSLFSASCEIDISWLGVQSHITRPDQGVNALWSLEQFLGWIRASHDPSILFGVGKVEAGTLRNITPGTALLQGTIRADSSERIDQFLTEINQVLILQQGDHRATFRVSLGSRYPEVCNDPSLVVELKNKLNPHYPLIPCELKRTAEDFGYFSSRYPSLMFWLGTGTEQKPVGLHHPDFHPDDSVIELGTKIWLELLGGK